MRSSTSRRQWLTRVRMPVTRSTKMWGAAADVAEAGPGELEDPALRQRDEGGGAGCGVEEGHLPDRLAGADGGDRGLEAALALQAHIVAAGADDEHRVAGVARADDHLLGADPAWGHDAEHRHDMLWGETPKGLGVTDRVDELSCNVHGQSNGASRRDLEPFVARGGSGGGVRRRGLQWRPPTADISARTSQRGPPSADISARSDTAKIRPRLDLLQIPSHSRHLGPHPARGPLRP